MLRACSSRSRKPTITNLPAVQTRGGDFSAIRVRKNTTSCLIAWPGYGWPITIRQATGRSSVLFSPIPSRPSPCLLTNRPNMFCPGRQGQRILFVTSFSDANVSQILRHFHLCLTLFFSSSRTVLFPFCSILMARPVHVLFIPSPFFFMSAPFRVL